MKKNKTLLQLVLTVAVFASLSGVASASGYGSYGPYGPHTPVDTSIAGTDLLSIAGLGLYGVGSIIVVYTSKLKKLILK